VTGPALNLPLLEADGYALFLQIFHRQPISTGYLARGSQQRHAQFVHLRRLLEEGGHQLCEGAARMGFRQLIIAPEAYWLRQAPLKAPLDFSRCQLSIVDMRRQDGASPARDADATWILPARPQSFPLVQGKTRIEFSKAEADAFLWYGWSGREPHSRWTEHRRAAIVFMLQEARTAVMHIRMSPYLSQGRLTSQRVRLILNGETLETLTLTELEAKEYSIQFPRQSLREQNELTFEMPDAQSPKQLGVGGDLRLLGINVQWIELATEDAGQQ
jgi:hypothetical protein